LSAVDDNRLRMVNTEVGTEYNTFAAGVFVFNLIVGVGVLALPSGFMSAGLIGGAVFLTFMALIAYMTMTFLVETLAAANCVLSTKTSQPVEPLLGKDSINTEVNSFESIQTLSVPELREKFEIKKRVEVGLMTDIFLGPWGKFFFYIVIIVYLFGDLSIYAVTVPSSLTAAIGGWSLGPLQFSDQSVYYAYLCLFIVTVVPFGFFNFQKTRLLQYLTMGIRNFALFTMMILGFIFIAQGNGASLSELPWFDWRGLPTMFGVSVYAFMCHHSLPSIVAPIKTKSWVIKLFAIDILLILFTYVTLSWSAMFAFGTVKNPTCPPYPGPPCKIQSLYIFNFSSYHIVFIAKFLGLFPVVTLSANYPLLMITLRNNVMELIPWGEKTMSPTVRRIVFSLICVVPALTIAFLIRDIGFLVFHFNDFVKTDLNVSNLNYLLL